jgi:hypothetical protein
MKKFNTIKIVAPLVLGACLFFYLNNKNNKQSNPDMPSVQAIQQRPLANNQVETKEGPLSILPSKKHFDDKSKAVKPLIAENPLVETNVDAEMEDEDMKGIDPALRISKQQSYEEALAYEIKITKDPALGYVPLDRKRLAMLQTKQMQADMVAKSSFLRGSTIQKNRWIPRGPGNVGGRTRAMMIDVGDATRNTMFAGGSTGGVFKTTNLKSPNTVWTRVNDYLDNLTVSSLAQDPRNPKLMFIGTGDVDGREANGNGIYRSKDGGNTWKVIPSSITLNFNLVPTIMVTPDSGYVFAGTTVGLYKSKDGGDTWEKVLGSGFRFGSTDDKFYKIERTKNGTYYACTTTRIYKSTQGGELGTWVNITKDNGYPNNLTRAEMAVSPTNANYVYVVGSVSGIGSPVYKSINGGDTWTSLPLPSWSDGCAEPSTKDFTRTQAWYDLSLAVSPEDPNTVFLGGVDFFKYTGGQSWQQITDWAGCSRTIQYAHADQHGAMFEPDNPNYLFIGTDGGVFMIENPTTGSLKVTEKTTGYVTTQFYSCAINPDSGINQFMAGAQDNGTLIVRSPGIGNARGRSIGGDGFYCFIDQNESKIQIGSLYYGAWFLSTDGGQSFSFASKSSVGNFGFLTPADYDSKSNTLYAYTNDGDLWRWKIGSGSGSVVDVTGINFNSISHIYVDENVNNRLYVGNGAQLYRVDNAHTTPNATFLRGFGGNISCVTAELGDSTHLLVTVSNFGVQSVFESKDMGVNWTNIEGNLPDMPVRWALFNPNDKEQALIATDAGIWSTDKIDSSRTVWNPPFPDRGSPLVRTDMLKIRRSDRTILAGTYGRGMWTSNSFSKAAAGMDYTQVTYIDAKTAFRGDLSNAAESYLWNFGNGLTDTLENTSSTYKTIGTYDVSLNINGDKDLITKGKIKVLPQLATPYKQGVKDYDGNFEGTNEHFGTYSTAGSKFERTRSGIFGKDGTHSGKNAYVLDPIERFYKKNTTAYLYTPMYDLSEKGIYQFSFWSLFAIERAYDGMQVEYSLDKGATWQVLGVNEPEWYNYKNTTLAGGVYPIGSNYFSNSVDDWTRFKLNITPLSGNKSVAFRFVFKASDQEPQKAGVAIDDVEVTKYSGELKTAVITQGGEYNSTGTSIDLKFQTQPEYLAKSLQVEVSENGRTYSLVNTLNAKGRSSEELQDYATKYDGARYDFYYFKIKVIHDDSTLNFYTAPFVVKRNKNEALAINRIYPNPFKDKVGILFNDVVDNEVIIKLYDAVGRLITTQTVRMKDVYYQLSLPSLAKGVYILSVKVGDKDPFVKKLFGGD